MPTTAKNHAGLSLPALIVWVAVAGSCGALLRVALVLISDEQFMRFPWATMAVNLVGSAALGLLIGLAYAWARLPKWAVPVLGTGFLGSFTTFSSVILAVMASQQSELFDEVTSSLVVPPELWEAGAYLVISMLFCTGAAAAGITVGKAVFGVWDHDA